MLYSFICLNAAARHQQTPREQGFTLLELSIVLVIIGLIIGGITVGKDLIRAAELNSIISEVDQYRTAVIAFKLKYNKIPGDMDNAHDYWDDGTNGVCGSAAQCNGDGDKLIENAGGMTSNEIGRAWQHLSLAGVIAGNYTGVLTFPAVLGVSHPESKIKGAGYSIESASSVNQIIFGTPVSTQSRPRAGVLTPTEAASIDQKADDGLPKQGSITAIDEVSAIGGAGGNNCLTTGDTVYRLTSNDVHCVMLFRLGL